jgi:hypothetical protein
MSSKAIADTFVIPSQFNQLIASDHCYLVGPRGSGKTTLLRMLQGETLGAWRHARADHYRDEVGFSSIFVTADRLWAAQADYESSDEHRSSLGTAAFATQLQVALVETLLYRLGRAGHGNILHPAFLSLNAEHDVVVALADAWGVQPRSADLEVLATSLDKRILQIGNILDPSARTSSEMTKDVLAALALSPVEALRFGLRTINRALGEPEHRWALLLDEMEIAPPSLHRYLADQARGGARELVLKLSFSPFDRFATFRGETAAAAAAGHDFRPIYLWSGNRRGMVRFANSMFMSMAEGRIAPGKTATDVLGVSVADATGTTWNVAGYESESDKLDFLRDMERLDQSFRDYLGRRGVDLDGVDEMSYNRKSATLRRFFPLLVFRDAIIDFERQPPGRRSRKKIPELMGKDAVFAALEGNPRWMKAVFGQMLGLLSDGGRIEPGDQYDALDDAAGRFESVLKLLPVDRRFPPIKILAVIDTIAAYFSRRALGPFSADTPTAFVVDDGVADSIQEALRIALYAGAVIHLRNKNSPPVLSTLVGEKFRLAYLLTIRDHLEVPMHLGKSVQLSRILAERPGGILPMYEEESDASGNA